MIVTFSAAKINKHLLTNINISHGNRQHFSVSFIVDHSTSESILEKNTTQMECVLNIVELQN